MWESRPWPCQKDALPGGLRREFEYEDEKSGVPMRSGIGPEDLVHALDSHAALAHCGSAAFH